MEVEDPQQPEQGAIASKAEDILKILLSSLSVILFLLLLNFIRELRGILIWRINVKVAFTRGVFVAVSIWVKALEIDRPQSILI